MVEHSIAMDDVEWSIGRRHRVFEVENPNVLVGITLSEIPYVGFPGVGDGDGATSVQIIVAEIPDAGPDLQHRQTSNRDLKARQMFEPSCRVSEVTGGMKGKTTQLVSRAVQERVEALFHGEAIIDAAFASIKPVSDCSVIDPG